MRSTFFSVFWQYSDSDYGIGVILGKMGVRTATFLEWEDGCLIVLIIHLSLCLFVCLSPTL